MEDTARTRIEKLKRSVIVSMAIILALVGGFGFLVMKVSLVRGVLGWLFGLSICFVLVHLGFRYIFRVQERLADHARRLSALNAITSAVSASLDLETTLNEALDKTLEALDTGSGLIYLRDAQNGRLRVAVHRGFSPDFIAQVEEVDIDHSLSGRVVRTGQPFVGQNLAASPVVPRELVEAQNVVSFVIIPLTAKGHILGTLNLAGTAGSFSSSEEVEWLSSIGRQIGIAVENARLYEETQEAMHDLARLREATVLASSSLNTEAILTCMADGMAKAIGADRCLIAVWDVDRGVVSAAAEYVSSERIEHLDPRPVTGKPGLLGDVPLAKDFLSCRRPVVIDARHPPPDGAAGARLRASGWAAMLAVPMIARSEVVGVAELYDVRPERGFTARQIELCQAMANQAALLVENARLYESALRRLSEMKTLHKVGKDLTGLVALPQLLQAIVDSAVATIAAANAGTIHLADERRSRLMPKAASNHQFVVAEMGGMPLGQGVAGLAWKEKRTIHISDVSRDPRFLTLDTGTSFQSLLVAPLMMGDRCLGTISLHSNETNVFTPDDERLLSTLASQAAIAIENARLFAAEESSRRKMEAVIQNMTDGLLIIDARCDIVLANQRAVELLGLTADHVAGRNLLAVCPYPSLKTLVREALDRLPHTINGEIDIEETGGHDLGVTIAPFIQNGEHVLWYVLLHDITRLKELDRMKSDFVSNVSHDLRTPLANIKFYAALAQKGHPEKRQHYLDTIESETERLEKLIEDILDLSRLERGVVKLHKEPLPLAEVIRQAADAHRATAQAKGIELTCQVAEGLPALHADRNQLLLMLNNLLGNALQYTPRGGSVRVEARAGEWQGRPALHIAVRDMGPGIPADEQSLIFKRFYRGRHNPPDATGTGLGLAIVKESMALHGGGVVVDSVVGQGSTFTLCFPLDSQARLSTVLATSHRENGGRETAASNGSGQR